MRSRGLELMILMGPFQLQIFCDFICLIFCLSFAASTESCAAVTTLLESRQQAYSRLKNVYVGFSTAVTA